MDEKAEKSADAALPHHDLHAALPREHPAHATIDRLRTEIESPTPDRRSIEKHVGSLRLLPELEATITNWWDDPNTQRYIMSHRVSRKGAFQLAASFGLFAALGNETARAAGGDGVTGAWQLTSFNVDEGKESEKPRFGVNPVGYLMYTPSGRMAAVLAGTRRPSLEPPPNTAPAHCAEAVADFLAYAGRYEVKGDHVFHHVEVCVFTNLIGKTLERQFAIEGDKLTIRTLPPEIWGTSSVLVWKRT